MKDGALLNFSGAKERSKLAILYLVQAVGGEDLIFSGRKFSAYFQDTSGNQWALRLNKRLGTFVICGGRQGPRRSAAKRRAKPVNARVGEVDKRSTGH